MKHLYQIASDYQKVIDMMESVDEITPELLNELGEVSSDAKQKVINVAAYIKNLESDSFNMEKYIKEMQERQSKVDKKIESLKDYLKYNMDLLDLKKVASEEFDVTVRTNNYSLELFDESSIPESYFTKKESITLSKKQIIDDLRIGCEVPGARFITKKSILIK